MLKEMTIDGTFNDKVQVAIDRIKTMVDRDIYYLAFSGGKDSIIILDLAEKAGVDIEPHFHFTTVDPPQLIKFVRDYYPEVTWDRPDYTINTKDGKKVHITSMFNLIEHKGAPPTRTARYCCEFLKEYGGLGRKVITGVRWEESTSRSKRRWFEQCSKNTTTYYLNPIIDWKKEDVWEYIHKNELSYCELYDCGFNRIGCVMCPLQTKEGMLRDAKTWPKYDSAYLKAFTRMLLNKKPTQKLQWKSAQDVRHWWIYGKHQDNTVQCEVYG